MTIYHLTPEPDERITTVWTRYPFEAGWTTWERNGKSWVKADGYQSGWAGLLVIGPVTDINPSLTPLADQIMDAGCGRDEVTAYRIAAVLWANGWRKSKPLKSNVFVTDENGLLKPTSDEPAAEPC